VGKYAHAARVNHETAKSISGKTMRLTSDDFSSDRKTNLIHRVGVTQKGFESALVLPIRDVKIKVDISDVIIGWLLRFYASFTSYLPNLLKIYEINSVRGP